MSDAATDRSRWVSAEFRTPEQEQAERGRNFPPAESLPLEELNPANPHLFRENRWPEYFERLRREDPVHQLPEAAGADVVVGHQLTVVDDDKNRESSVTGRLASSRAVRRC